MLGITSLQGNANQSHVKHHFPFSRMVTVKERAVKRSLRMWSSWNLCYLVRNIKQSVTLEISVQVLIKSNIKLSFDPQFYS